MNEGQYKGAREGFWLCYQISGNLHMIVASDSLRVIIACLCEGSAVSTTPEM